MRARREKRKLEQEHRRAAGHAVSAHSQLRPTTETRHGQDVGSSGSLLFHPARGAEIDRADLVVRFNDAPVEGFERFVGNRTDVRLNNTYAIGKVLAGCAKRGGGAPWTNQIPTAPKGGPSTCSAFLGFPKDNACCPREYMILNSGFGTYARCAQRLCPRSADARVLAGPAARSVKGRHAWMSGSLGMLALSKWCERGVTNLYGFDLAGSYDYHYYEGCRKAVQDAHTDYARQLMQALGRYRHPVLCGPEPNARRLCTTPLFDRDVCHNRTRRQCGKPCPIADALAVAANATSRHNADDDDAAARAGQHARRTRKGWGKKSIARTIGRTRKGWGKESSALASSPGASRSAMVRKGAKGAKGRQRVPKWEGAGDDG